MQLRSFFLLLALIIGAMPLASQNDSTVFSGKPEINFHGFVDTYYRLNANKPENSNSRIFLVSHNREQEFAINNAIIGMNVTHTRYRGNFGVHAGTFVDQNYITEFGTARLIYEANAGISFDKKNKWWLDAGVFQSYIGGESMRSIDNLTLTRSLIAEASPYYMTGARLSYQPDSALSFALYATNGWQRIYSTQRDPSFGTQVRYQPDQHTIINWSTFAGPTGADGYNLLRYFNNLYVQFLLTNRTTMFIGVDMGIQQFYNDENLKDRNSWLGGALIIRQQLSDEWAIAGRAEYFGDEDEIVLYAQYGSEFRASSFSLNLDYNPTKNAAFRIEPRIFLADGSLFDSANGRKASLFMVTSSIAIAFGE